MDNSSIPNYLNRELSWLEFNKRVLDQAFDQSNPLLERLKFLAISGSNLDEFFKVRVGGLKIALSNKSDSSDPSGMTIGEQLDAVRLRIRKMNTRQSECLLDQLEPALAKEGIVRCSPGELSEKQKTHLLQYFDSEIVSTVAPIAFNPDGEFPQLLKAKIAFCVRLKFAADNVLAGDKDSDQQERFVILPISGGIDRCVRVPSAEGYHYVLVEEVMGMFLERLFPGQEVLDWCTFRITRNADIAVDDMMHDLLAEMTQLLEKRKISELVRLEVSDFISPSTLEFLQSTLSIADEDIYRINGPLDLSSYFELASVKGFPNLKDEPWPSQKSPAFSEGKNIFDVIAAGDQVLIHPYQSYDPVVEFIQAAAEDEQVVAIKQTLYRSSRNSEIISALARAADNGKSVTVIIELKARFDEARNIEGARKLERAGVDVIYGVQGLKTHAKICVVVRREPTRGIQRYIHFGTGNYNESTATLYSDVSYFTNNDGLGTDAVHLFNAVTGMSVPQSLEFLSAAPIDLRDTLLDLISIETQNAINGAPAAINAKLNSLVDRRIIDALYEASNAGVEVRLNIRGICCLRPGVKGQSENIRVISIVDRFLEHARILHFRHGGDDLVYIASADWMPRNLDRRVELLVPVLDKECKNRIQRSLMTYFADNVKATELAPNGSYQPVERTGQAVDFRAQEHVYREACDTYSAFSDPKTTVFKARRGESV